MLLISFTRQIVYTFEVSVKMKYIRRYILFPPFIKLDKAYSITMQGVKNRRMRGGNREREKERERIVEHLFTKNSPFAN